MNKKIIIACLLLVAPAVKAAEMDFSDWAWDYFVNGATLKLGVGTRQAGIRAVRTSDNAEGKIVQRNEESYFISYSTRPYFFSIKNTGMTFVFNVSSFNANQQQVGSDSFVDLGTETSGLFYYVVPTAFYQWGDHAVNGTYTRAGLGLGLGVARFNGDVLLTSTAANERLALEQKGTSVTFATSLIIESHWQNWGLTFNYAGPVYEADGYQVNVEDVSINLGYQFVF
ncbi:MAG: hypothetical protein WBN96_05315 [Gammaproteobacteria bacterium]